MNQKLNVRLLKTAFLLLSFGFSACAYKIEKNAALANSANANESKAQLTFSLIQASVLVPKCVHCHSNATKNSGKVNLETYANVFASLSDIKDQVTEGKMPKAPDAPLTEEEKFLLLTWIQMGAPESAPVAQTSPTPTPSPVAPVPTDPPVVGLQPSFASINSLIIQAKCIECHKSGGKADDVPFEQYSDIVNGDIVVAGDPAKSSLIRHIAPGSKKIMPPLKSDYKAIAPEDVAIISEWISKGALNN